MQNKRPYKDDVYQEFIIWSAMPPTERYKIGILDQTDFAERYNVNKDTLTRWKERPDFETRIDKVQKTWAVGKTADITHAIYRSAIKGSASSQKLWLQYVNRWKPPKKDDVPEKPILPMTEDDLRYLIQGLPEWLQEKYFTALRELLDDCTFFFEKEDRIKMTKEEFEQYQKDNPL